MLVSVERIPACDAEQFCGDRLVQCAAESRMECLFNEAALAAATGTDDGDEFSEGERHVDSRQVVPGGASERDRAQLGCCRFRR